MHKYLYLLLLVVLSLFSCKTDPKPSTETKTTEPHQSITVPAFDAQSAFDFVAAQVALGPRVPGTPAQESGKAYLVNTLEKYTNSVHQQAFTATFPDGSSMPGTNIIAQINPAASHRVTIAAHWDSRIVADEDTHEPNKPIDGADDGASGVGIILQLAKTLSENPIDMGVDFVLFDVEDQGGRHNEDPTNWCKGSQHWAANLYPPDYNPAYAILLDMVGAKGATFEKEGYSHRIAPKFVNKLWQLALNMGKGGYFINQVGNPITDDHYFVHQIAGIPMIDIINLCPECDHSGFGKHWHTHDDNLENISPETLGAVGQVLTAFLYQESVGNF